MDGGTNFLPRDAQFKPDIIAGDFDSVDKESVDFFQNLGSRVVSLPDQDHTDFTKAVQVVLDDKDVSVDYVIAFTSVAGRPDHVLSNFHTLFFFIRKIPVILVESGVSITCALESVSLSFSRCAGASQSSTHSCIHAFFSRFQGVKHVIASPSDASSWCSLVPLTEPSVLTTTGLKWNLSGEILKFGHFISTSNQFASSSGLVEVECSTSVLWSMKDVS